MNQRPKLTPILPTVYGESLSYLELLGKVVEAINGYNEAFNNGLTDEITAWIQANYNELFFNATYDANRDTLVMSLAEKLAAKEGNEPVSYFELAGQVLEIVDAAVRDRVTAVESGLNTTNGKVEQLSTDLDSVEADVAVINSTLRDSWGLDNIVFIGDSYVQGYGLSSPSAQNFAKLFCNMVGASKAQIFGGGGIGFAHRSASINMTATEYFNSIQGSITEPESVESVIVCLGWNDADQDASDVTSGANTFWSAVKRKMPNAKLYFFTNPAYTVVKKQVLQAVYNAAMSNRVKSFDSHYWMLLRDSDFQSDHVHPNSSGAAQIATKLATSFLGGKPFNYAIKPVSNVSGFTFNLTAINETIHVYLSGTKQSNERATRIGNFPPEVFLGNKTNGPVLKFRHVLPLGDTTKSGMGYIQWDKGNYNIYCCSMTEIGGSGLSSGGFVANITSPAIMLLG